MAPWFRKKKVVSFLVSGSGLNFDAVARKIISKDIPARIGAVVTDNSTARVKARAVKLGIPVYYVDPGICSVQEFEEEIVRIFEKYKTDLIVAAGFLRLLSPYFINRYRNRIINIHPSLLPAFPGIRSQSEAIECGVKITGCTTHFIDEGMDTGPIILQTPVPVLDSDTVKTLSARILNEEYSLLSETVRLFCEGSLDIVDNRVIIRA